MISSLPRPVIYLAAFAVALHLTGAEPLLHLPFESGDRVIREVGGETVGLHFPTSIEDQDDPGSVSPDRFRGEARYGKGIRYFASDRSFTRVEKMPRFEGPIEAVAVSAEIKVEPSGQNRFAALVTNRVDSDKRGFSLFLWGKNLRFRFGDGETVHEIRVAAPQLRDGKWHSVQAAFERGRAAVWVDGTRLATDSFDAATIAPPVRDLHLGGYPADNKGRVQYAYDGWLDEVAIGKLRGPLVGHLREVNKERANFEPPPAMRTLLLPVRGSEVFFGGERVFHSFHGHPVPMTFMFSADLDRLRDEHPKLVFYLPGDVEVAALYQSNHNEPGGPVAFDMEEVQRDGRTWKRYATRDLDITKGGRGWKDRDSPFLSLAVDADPSVKESKMIHAIEYAGRERGIRETTLKFLPPPPRVPEDEKGRFHAFGYLMLQTFAYPDRDLWAPTADLLSRVGLTGRGRFYSGKNGQYRRDFDRYVRERGFTLYEIGLWAGPNRYDMAANPEATTEAYASKRGHRMRGLKEGEPVIFDYEPWGVTYKARAFAKPIRAAFGQQLGLETPPTRSEIRTEYRREWTDFWLDVCNNVYGAMSEVVVRHHRDPEAPRVAYTYFYPYDDEAALYRRFWSIPKDPRMAEESDHVDVHLISLYHTNDRELVDQTRLSQKHLDRPIWGISAIGRVNPIHHFATPENSLSPQRIEQKFVLTGALGMERQGIWPGRGWFDAAYLAGIGNASRFIWRHEDFYFDGERVNNTVSVIPQSPADREDWAHLVHRHEDGRLLVTAFNFTDRELSLRAKDPETNDSAEISVEPRGYATHTFGVQPIQTDSESEAP